MEDKVRCQSCGMPLGEGWFGTENDGSVSADFCKLCYVNGAFTEPQMSLEEMIEQSVSYMTSKLNYNEKEARSMSQNIISGLKRWQT